MSLIDKKIVLAIGGSSGSIYAMRLMTKLATLTENILTAVIMSENAKVNWELEIGQFNKADWPFDFYTQNNFNAPFASGSAKYETMIICPASPSFYSKPETKDQIADTVADRVLDLAGIHITSYRWGETD